MRSLSAVITLLFAAQTQAIDVHEPATHDPYIPPKYNLGVAIGSAWSTSSYILVQGSGGTEILRCGFHCFSYIDGALAIAAQNGETNYQGTVGWRFQKYFDDSSWGPFFRPLIGMNHYLFSGQMKDLGFGGAAVGTYYYLHPGADLRFELGQVFGPQSWTFLSVGFDFKFKNI